ncbi:AraC family transcriptional regulator [Vibrio harveyi]|uniref:AraC family transcriptional regulator n=1 Tax=Vibrio harveyi TaxID=669 RepID=UPI000680F746|nr:AraC family transcriptional regulator [Vibrio harveyi]
MKNQPLLIEQSADSCGITLRSMWDVHADMNYHIKWPRDRMLPMLPNAIVAVYTTQGSGCIKMKSGKILTVSAPSVTFIDSRNIDSYWTNGIVWNLNWFEFLMQGVTPIPFEEPIALKNDDYPSILSEVKALIASKSPIKLNAAVAGFGFVFYKWLTLIDQSKSMTSQEKTVHEIVAKMSENIGENIAIKQFAQEAGYTEQYLRKLFLKYLNVTPKQYYLKLKLDASMMMLKRSGTNVKRVAFELGFNDSFHFSRAFKKQFGVCPSKANEV